MAALMPRAPARAVARAITNFRIIPMVSFFFDSSIRYDFYRLVKLLPRLEKRKERP